MPSENLNDPFIKFYKAPDKRVEVYDENIQGLALRVTPTGHKSFVFRYRYNNKVKRYTIGSYPNVGLAQARSDAKELSYKVSRGIDPNEEKRQNKKPAPKEFTFSELCERFKKRHLPSLRKSTSDEYLRIIDKELNPVFGRFEAKEISRKQIIDLLDKIAYDRKTVTLSNRIRSVISSIFSFGVDKAIVEVNPVLSIRKKKNSNKRDRVYSEKELKILWKAFENQAEPIQSIYKMLLISGQRSSETRRIKWAHLDFEKKLWTIPEEETKGGRTHIVPLSEMALELLSNIKPLTSTSNFVFKSPKSENAPIRWVHKATERIKIETGIDDFRPHDLRRTMASNTAQLGTERTVLGKILNHSSMAGDDTVTSIYDRYDYLKERRDALQKWSKKLKEIIKDA